jgi:hypothetical protein
MDYLPFLVPVFGAFVLQGIVSGCIGCRLRQRYESLEGDVSALRGRVAQLEASGPGNQAFLGGYTFAQMPTPSAPPYYPPPAALQQQPQVVLYR